MVSAVLLQSLAVDDNPYRATGTPGRDPRPVTRERGDTTTTDSVITNETIRGLHKVFGDFARLSPYLNAGIEDQGIPLGDEERKPA